MVPLLILALVAPPDATPGARPEDPVAAARRRQLKADLEMSARTRARADETLRSAAELLKNRPDSRTRIAELQRDMWRTREQLWRLEDDIRRKREAREAPPFRSCWFPPHLID